MCSSWCSVDAHDIIWSWITRFEPNIEELEDTVLELNPTHAELFSCLGNPDLLIALLYIQSILL